MATEEAERELRPFNDWLADQRGGRTHDELTKSLSELVAAVALHGKVGSLTFTIKVKPAGDGMVGVEDKVTVTAPKPDRSMNIYFVDDDANLHRENPRQQKLALREVPTNDNIREISNDRAN